MSRGTIILWALLFSAFGLSFYSCENCDDCGPLQKEPAITLKFINQDSLDAVRDSLITLAVSIEKINTTLESIKNELSFYNDSIQSVTLAIAAGEALETLLSTLHLKFDSLQTTFGEFQEFRLDEEDKVNQLSVVETTIKNGKIRIDSLLSKTNETVLDFGTDSLESFRFPLSVNLDSTAFGIFIDGSSYELSLEYVRNFKEDEKSRIEVIISNIKIRRHTFKEAIISCEVCTNNETSITLFF